MLKLRNRTGVEIAVLPYGGIITSIATPDRDGQFADIVLGFNDARGYLSDHPYFGAVIGRYGNRIANARFVIDGLNYMLAANHGRHHLHGGRRGFDKHEWDSTVDDDTIALRRVSPDGEEGYPGRLEAAVSYRLTDANELVITYTAQTDQATHVNLTQHSYFNLRGEGDGDVLDHEVTINAARFTPVDEELIPTGRLAPVEGTQFDFRQRRAIRESYDHNWVLDGGDGELRHAASVRERTTGRTLDVFTTEPGLQFYTGNFLDGSLVGKSGRGYARHGGFCLETQHFPNSPNEPSFPSTLLRPGEQYRTRTIYRFGVS